MYSNLWKLLCALLALTATATPLRMVDDTRTAQQQILGGKQARNKGPPARPVLNSVGVLFTVLGGVDVVHVWIPLGRKIYTRDVPELPIHPLAARITTMIRSTPENASREHLDTVVCKIHPRYNRTKGNQDDGGGAGEWSVSFSKGDGLVRFAEVGSDSWLVGRAVEAYECS